MEFRLVQQDESFAPIKLIEPSRSGYMHIAAEVQPSAVPFLPPSADRTKFLAKLTTLARQLERLDPVERASVYDATAIPPFEKFPNIRERIDDLRIPRFDVAVLVDTTSPEQLAEVRNSAPFKELMALLEENAKHIHVMAARNAKRIQDVDRSKDGTFLFNYFVANDREVLMELWDYIAGWYGQEMKIDNSLLLEPVLGETSDYTAVNHARLKGNAIGFVARQMARKSFKDYVQANLYANRVIAMPVLYKLVQG